jgi:hypothetical protein
MHEYSFKNGMTIPQLLENILYIQLAEAQMGNFNQGIAKICCNKDN